MGTSNALTVKASSPRAEAGSGWPAL